MVLFSCGVKKTIPDEQFLLRKNLVVVHDNKTLKEGDLKAQILHRPNKRVLFNRLPVFLWSYAIGSSYKHPEKNDSVAWRSKLRNQWGEPPVLVSEALTKLSSDNIRDYLFNEGYFDARVSQMVYKSKRKAKVVYHIYPERPYKLKSFVTESVDSNVLLVVDSIIAKKPIYRQYWPLNLNNLNDAKTLLTSELRDRGYFEANPSCFRYEIDTAYSQKEGSVYLIVSPPSSAKSKELKPFKFGKLYLEIQCSSKYKELNTPEVVVLPGKVLKLNHYTINLSTLTPLLQIDSGSLYSQIKTNQTYQALVELGIFSFVDIRQELDSATETISTFLTAKAYPRMFWNAEPQVLYSPQGSSGTNFQTQSQQSFGLAGILSFTNRNVFGNAENLRISSITSWEAIFKRGNIGDFNFAQGIQQGVNAQLSLPNFRLLNELDSRKVFERKNTVFSLSYQFENNPNFLRSSLPASISFQFIRPKLSWYYTPLEVSYNRNVLSNDFLPKLPQLDQDFVKRVFTNQLISASKVGIILANDRNKPGTNYYFIRMGFEASGNLHRLYRYLFEPNYNPDSNYQFLGVNYFQYSKVETEFRYRITLDELNSIAVRAKMGLAIPYGNSEVIPYDKRYFIGGSNSLRGWRPRGLGPGNTPSSVGTIIDRSGEIIYEANVEYRFTLIKNFIESALFMDAGNIWNFSDAGGSTAGYGVINRKKFLGEVAVNTGIGMRFDLEFFMFRLDWGWPLRDPSKAIENRWVLAKGLETGFGKYLINETNIVIGLDYPF